MTSTEQKKIRVIAGLLPPFKYFINERVEISGEDLLLSGTSEVDGKTVDAEKTYLMKSPVILEGEHYRRLKRRFIKSGTQGIVDYLSLYVKDKEGLIKIVDVLFSGSKQAAIKR
jgi:hypothetical protein